MDAKVRRPIVLSGVAAFLVATVLAQAPSPPGQAPARDNTAPQTGTARVRGRVTTSDGAPLRRAQLRLSGGGLVEPRIVASDADGRYEIRDLPSGRFTLAASKGGYLTLSYGQRRPLEAARPLEIANGQVFEGIDFHLPLGGVVIARVTDEFGEPVADAEVQLRHYQFVQGQRTLAQVRTGGGPFPEATDDIGEVRLFGIPPGDYYVAATIRTPVAVGPADRGLSYSETYYPGTSLLGDAQRISVAIGKEASVAFSLVTTRAAVISGVVRRSDGTPAAQSSVSVTEYYGTGIRSRGAGTVQPNGTFRIANVLPGDYYVEMRSLQNSPNAEFASVPVKVTGDDVTNLAIATTKYGEIHGKVVFDGEGAAGVTPQTLTINATASIFTGSIARATVHDDWTFDITGLTHSRFLRLGPASPVGWYLKAVMLGGADVIDVPIDVSGGAVVNDVQAILTRKRAEVSGTVAGEDGKPVTEYAAVLFPEDRSQWTPNSRFIASVRSDQQGVFKVAGLPPGRYLAAAVEYLETGAERDPDLLNRLRDSAQSVTLVEAESIAVRLKLGSY